MKQLLLNLLHTQEPSRVTLNNCIHLVNHDNLNHAVATHEQLLARGRDAALESAQFMEGALQTARLTHLDHNELLASIRAELAHIDRDLQSENYKAYHAGLAMMRDRLRTLLIDHESARQQRALRRT